MSELKAVLFDLDGTLIDTHRLYAEAYRHAFTLELGRMPSPEEFADAKPASERYFLLRWFGAEVGDRIHQRMLEHYEARAEELLGGFYDGVREMIEAVQARGLKMAIVTGKSGRAYASTAKYLDLSMFRMVVVEEDVHAAKPDPAGIQRAHRALGGGAAVYVGDTPMDAEAAQRAGLTAAAALWSRSPADRERVAAQLAPEIWPLAKPTDLIDRLG